MIDEGEMRKGSTAIVTDVLPLRASNHPVAGVTPEYTTTIPIRNEKVVATSSGLTMGIALIQPVLYIESYEHNDPSTKKLAILRGQLHLKVTKCVKIQKIAVRLRGHAQTDWPKGTPPNKIEDKEDFFDHGVVYFNNGAASFTHNDYGAHYFQHAKHPSPGPSGRDGADETTRKIFSKTGFVSSPTPTTETEATHRSTQTTRGRSQSFSWNELPGNSQAPPQHNYRMFPEGDYLYSFEIPVDGLLPETIKRDLGFVRYDLEAIVERSGTFRPKVLGSMEIPVVRIPAEGSLEQVEPIAISSNWEDKLHYGIVISGKTFPLGSQIPIAMKLTPLAKVECHRIEVYMTENIQYRTADKSKHRRHPAKKVLLFEKRAKSASTSLYPGSSMCTNAGGGIDWDYREAAQRGEDTAGRTRLNMLGPTEMEFNVQLPSCHEMKDRYEAQCLHFDTTYENIQISHWINIVLHMAKVDEKDPTSRTHFPISFDSLVHILSCKATQANIYLPTYTLPAAELNPPAREFECGCPRAPLTPRGYPVTQYSSDHGHFVSNSNRRTSIVRPVSRSSTNRTGDLARPPHAHSAYVRVERDPVPRPMHLLRTLSFAPPAFEDVETPPPPFVTPPPQYTSVMGNRDRETVLGDYFSRLSFSEESNDDRGRASVDAPFAPGGRVNRNLNVPRE